MLNLSEISVVVEPAIDKLLISGYSVEQFLNLMDSAMRFYTVSVELGLSQNDEIRPRLCQNAEK